MSYHGFVTNWVGVAVAAASLGCGRVERVYTWTRQEPAQGRTSPTVYEVRFRVDEAKKTVRWIEDVGDRDGEIGRHFQTWFHCEIFTKADWECVNPVIPHLRIEMKDGNLRQSYWGEDRRFHSRYAVWTSDLLRQHP